MFERKLLKDKDLEFLEKCSNEDLQTLADLLVYDADGQKRFSEKLSGCREYNLYYPKEINRMWQELAHEFQCYGANTIATFVRGYGVCYREILMDVCNKKNVNFNKKSSTERIEMYLIQKIMDDVIDEMDDEQLQDALHDFGLDTKMYESKDAIKDVIIMACMSPVFLEKVIALLAKTIVPRFAVGAITMVGLSRFGGMFIPAMNTVMTALLMREITGTAYRVVIPGTVLIIYMRRKLNGLQ